MSKANAALSLAQNLKNGSISCDIRQFDAKCDGGASQSGTISSSGVISDTTPPTRIPVSGQLVTWVGLGAAVGGGITGASMASSGSAPVITTSSTHGLTTGQQIKISGVSGAIQANGVWPVTVLSPTTFSIPLNTAVFGVYTSGGTVQPTTTVFGYVSNPVVSSGTLTFTIVTAKGGNTPFSIPSGLASGGTYYYGSDDTAAWNAAITQARAIGTTTPNPVRITWTGISMVSSTIVVNGNVLLDGDYYDYTNPDGTNSSSTLPERGSILRAHGNFANPLTSALLQLGNQINTSSGIGGSSTRFGVFDGANIVMSAVRILGARNVIDRSYACNGIQRAYDGQGSNTVFIEPIAGQSNTGDALYIANGDNKLHGGYLRQACNMLHIAGGGDFYADGGTHMFNGYNGGNEQYGNDVLIDASAGTPLTLVTLANLVYDGVIGSHIRVAPVANATINLVNIPGAHFFQPTNSSYPDNTYPVLQIDTTQSGSAVNDVGIHSFSGQSYSSTARYKSLVDTIGSNATRLTIGAGNAVNCCTHYTGTLPRSISPSALYNGNSTAYSDRHGTATFTGNGSTTQFSIAHFISETPIYALITPMTSASGGAWATFDGSNVYFNFSTAPANGASLEFSYRAGI